MCISYHIYTYTCMYIHARTHIQYIHINTYIHTYIHMRENRKAGIGGNRGLHALSLRLYACTHVCMYECMHACMYVCIGSEGRDRG